MNDTNVTTVIFPKVMPGSRLYSKARTIRHTPSFPGQFGTNLTLHPEFKIQHAELIVTAPKNMTLFVKNNGFEGGPVNRKGTKQT